MDDVVFKPCPFCGGEAEVRICHSCYNEYYLDYTFPSDNYIVCKKCGAESGHIYGAWLKVWNDVVDLWNKRV